MLLGLLIPRVSIFRDQGCVMRRFHVFCSTYRVHVHTKIAHECRSVHVRVSQCIWESESSVSGGPWDGVSALEFVFV